MVYLIVARNKKHYIGKDNKLIKGSALMCRLINKVG